MAINIIDGFYLGGSVPIDSRFSVTNLTERNNIQYKYDGLRVYVSSEKKFFYWDSDTSSWKEENSGSLSGSGTENRVPKFSSGGLTNSAITSTGSFVGINTTDPKDSLQINNLGNPIVVGNRTPFGYVSYNSYYFGNNVNDIINFQSTQGSSIIRFSNDGSINFQTRIPNSTTFTTPFQINASFSSVRYNVFTGLNSIGTASFGNSTSPNFSNKLVSINGSTIFNSSVYYRSTSISFDGSQITVTNVDINGNTTTSTSSGTTYNLQINDHNVTINNSSNQNLTLQLPTLTASEIGREVTIIYQTSVSSTGRVNISSGSDIIDENGSIFSLSVRTGQSIKIQGIYTGVSSRAWKVTDVSDSLFLKGSTGDFIYFDTTSPQRWKSIPFESKMREILGSMTSTSTLGTFRLKFGTGANLSEIFFPQSGTSSVRISGGGVSGDNGLFIENNNVNFIRAVGSNSITNSGLLYIISTNNDSGSSVNTGIKIQTTPLSLQPGSLIDTPQSPGSIQVVSRSKISLISQTGEYFLGDRTGGLSSLILPPSPGTSLSANILMLDNSGRIYRTSSDTNVDSNWLSYTPTIVGSNLVGGGTPILTFTQQSGRYKKIGRTLFLNLIIKFSVNGTCNSFTISLPSGLQFPNYAQEFREVYYYGSNTVATSTPSPAFATSVLAEVNGTRLFVGHESTTGSLPGKDYSLSITGINPLDIFSLKMDLVLEVI